MTLLGYRLERWTFYSTVLLGGYGLVILTTFFDYGVTVDEPPLLHYGNDIVQWYKSRFSVLGSFETSNTKMYGGLVHVLGYALSQFLPLDPYDGYHLTSALIGFSGVVAAYRIGSLLGSGPTGFLVAAFLIFTPRYYAHIFNNPKDIPFAVFYLWSVFWILRSIGRLPDLSGEWVWKIGLVVGLTMACRTTGWVLIFYICIFWSFQYALLVFRGLSVRRAIRILLTQMGAIFGIAYAIMLPFWPWALAKPITRPFEALGYFSKFLEPHHSFFEGQYLLSIDVPWYYVSKWLLLTLPEFVLLGLFLGTGIAVLFGFRHRTEIQVKHVQCAALIWSGVFPIIYAALAKTPFYDGHRHMLFVVPPLVICSVLGWTAFWHSIKTGFLRRAIQSVTAALVFATMIYMVRIHPNQSVYFNHLVAGGIKEAWRRYETDYWGNSYKQGLDWVTQNYAWDYTKGKLRLASPFGPLNKMMDPAHLVQVEPYETADLYIGSTRFDHHRLIPGEILHTVRADEVPLLYVIRPDRSYQHEPFFADSPFRWIYRYWSFDEPPAPSRVTAFLEQIEDLNLHYFMADAYTFLAAQQDKAGDYEKAVEFYSEALSFYPEHFQAQYHRGRTLFHQAKYDAAIKAFQHALTFHPESPDILNDLASVCLAKEDLASARKVLRPVFEHHSENVKYHTNILKAYGTIRK